MTIIYTIWDDDTRACIAKDVDRDTAIAVLTARGLRPKEIVDEFLEDSGPPGSIALDRYGFTVLVEYEPAKVHTFTTSRDAYDASQTSDNIRDGDVLLVPSEHVTGVLVEAWPVAIIWDPDSQIGCFHRLAGDTNVSDIDGKDYGDSFELAVMVASERLPCPNCGEASIGSGGNYNPLDVDVTVGSEYSGPDTIASTTIGSGCPVCNTANERTP